MLDTFQGGDILKTDFQFQFDLVPMFTEQLNQWISGEFKDRFYNQKVYSRFIRASCKETKESFRSSN